MNPVIVGIAGGTASGKTTIAEAFSARVGALLVTHDRYYREFRDPSAANFDHPDALETSLLVRHLEELRSGAAPLPTYDFHTHRRTGSELVRARPVIVVEGILVLESADLRARLDLAVFVAAPADIRFIRRLRRDLRERGRSVDSVVEQYLGTVRPMHEQFVAPSERHASLVLDGTAPVEASVQALLAALG